MAKERSSPDESSSANLGFGANECGIWLADDKLGNNMDDAEDNHVGPGLFFPANCGSGPAGAGSVPSEKFVESHGGTFRRVLSFN